VRGYGSGHRPGAGGQGPGAGQSNTSTPSASPQQAGGTPANRPQDAGAPTDFESSWRKWLHDGFIPNTALPTKTVTAKSDLASSSNSAASQLPAPGSYQVVFRPDASIYDGRFANNGWLQELPKPLTKITWDNVALVSANTATKLGLAPQNYEERDHGREAYVDTIKLTLRDRTIIKSVPAWIMPGQPDDVITIHLGYGRKPVGRVWDTIPDPDSRLPQGGFNAYDVRFSDQPWSASGASVSKTAERFLVASTQAHFTMDGRDLLRASS